MDISIHISIAPEEMETVLSLFKRENMVLPLSIRASALPEADAPARTNEPKQKRVTAKGATSHEVLLPTAKILAPGNIAWQVEVDGFPTRWMLDYSKGQLPAVRGEDVSHQGKRYRITHIYGNSLKLTSMEAETYEVQGGDNGIAGMEAVR